MEATWQPQWQAQWGGLEAGMYVPSQPATGVVTSDMTHALSCQQSGTQVELHVACKDLVNLDTFSKSDPICVVYEKESNNKWKEIGRTEIIWDNLNPKWVTSFKIAYHFEKVQPLMFKVYDIDDKNASLDKQDFIGHAECRLSELMTSSGQTLVLTLVNEHKPSRRNGKVMIMGEEINNTIPQDQVATLNVRDKFVKTRKEFFRFKFSAHSLDRKDLFGKSDPFFIILRSRESGRAGEGDNWVPVYKSETIKLTLNPNWAPFEISGEHLNNGDPKRPLLIQIWDWNRNGAHSFIGQVETDTEELCSHRGEFPVINSKRKAKKKRYRDSGLLRVEVHEKEQREQRIPNPYYGYNAHSFLEYIAGGCQISLIIAIDFTASNGSPKDPKSLHYIDPTGRKQNEYVAAITSVGQILSDYDSDKRYPVYGFGAKKKAEGKSGTAHHCFALNGNESDGIDGVVQAYEKAFEHWILSGPTNFAEIISAAADMAKSTVVAQRQNHFILLILTDGIISDMRETTREIVRASILPLSIVIVGVGDADFKDMDVLDADDNPLVYNGQEMERDIVQFEIPWQLTSFMAINDVKPNPRSAFQYPSSSRNSFAGLQPPASGTVPFPAGGPPSQGAGYPGSAPPAVDPAYGGMQQVQQQQGQTAQLQQQGPPQWNSAGQMPPMSGQYPPPQHQSWGGPPMSQQYYPQQQQQWQGGPSGQQPYYPQYPPSQQYAPQQQYPPQQQQQYAPQSQQQQPRDGATPPTSQGVPYMPQQQQFYQQPPPPMGGPAYPDHSTGQGYQPPMQQQQPPQQPQFAAPPVATPPPADERLDTQLEELLTRLGYLNFRETFLKEKLTYEALKEFEKDDLKELGLPAGPRIAIYNAMHKAEE